MIIHKLKFKIELIEGFESEVIALLTTGSSLNLYLDNTFQMILIRW